MWATPCEGCGEVAQLDAARIDRRLENIEAALAALLLVVGLGLGILAVRGGRIGS